MVGHAVCTAHQGKHGVSDGRCVLVGAEVRRPFTFKASVCQTCGFAVDIRRCSVTGVAETLCAGTDTPHRHEPPIRVALDPDDLADAIVRASRSARQERQPQPQPQRETETALPRQANGKPALGGIPEWDE